MLPETPKENASLVATRIRQVVSAHKFPNISRRITISIGIAGIPDPSIDNAEKLIHEADLVLHEAKRKGGNTIEIA